MSKNPSLEQVNAQIADIMRSGRSKAPDAAPAPAPTITPKTLADFTRVVKETGILKGK